MGKMKFRAQYDGREDEVSDATGIDTGTETPTRQEFKDEADINNILTRFGVAQQRPLRYGDEIDYSTDLQDALHALDQVQGINDTVVPPELKEKYGDDWRKLLNAVESGEYQHDLEDLARAKAEAAVKDDPGIPDPDPARPDLNARNEPEETPRPRGAATPPPAPRRV